MVELSFLGYISRLQENYKENEPIQFFTFLDIGHVVASLTERSLCLIQNQSQCLADLCGALHCDIEINFGLKKSKCNPAVAARNKHLCENLADSCFPVNDGPAACRLHEFFLHQFCDAHSCTGSRKPFSRGHRKKTNAFYIVAFDAAATLLSLYLLYLLVIRFLFLSYRGMKRETQLLRRISQTGRKKKPS
ncbi:uncharacterized protein LOC130933894 [Arachis stenosperma]|uniref:uncharacterized protein LOC130933894 n=1 Tax=Arachis stenosperma TaxID=217475 RepID=UPI0025AD43E4|nr:uncharacterized protein LOC130933894 [Arachis stenosperma]